MENGDTITFSFLVIQPHRQDVQDFFGYKIAVNQEPPTGGDDNTDSPADEEPDLPSGSASPATGDPFDVTLCALICLAALDSAVMLATCRKAGL